MALLSLQNAKILVGQADLSGYSNSVEVAAKAEELDATTFASAGWKEQVGGLKDVAVKVGGLWSAGTAAMPDDRLFADLGVAAVPMTISPTGVVADPAYFTKVMRASFTPGAAVGELLKFDSSAVGDGTALIRGAVADNQARTTTGTTTVLSLQAPTASTRVYAAIHVLSVSGSGASLTATLQGDNASGFPSPATVATGSAITAAGSQWLAGSYGVNADSFFRLSYVISGSSPSFTVLAVIGVGA